MSALGSAAADRQRRRNHRFGSRAEVAARHCEARFTPPKPDSALAFMSTPYLIAIVIHERADDKEKSADPTIALLNE